jgi:hypothetical protein
MEITKLVKIARAEAIKEIEKFGSPPLELFEISEKQALSLAKKRKADVNVVLIGSLLADYKLGQAIKENRLGEHVKMSSDAALGLLRSHKVDEILINKILHCIEAHHGTVPYKFIEAEIVANADCYRFLTIRGIIAFIRTLSQRDLTLDNILDYCEDKINEKWDIVSMPEVKKELGSEYKQITELILKAKK